MRLIAKLCVNTLNIVIVNKHIKLKVVADHIVDILDCMRDLEIIVIVVT